MKYTAWASCCVGSITTEEMAKLPKQFKDPKNPTDEELTAKKLEELRAEKPPTTVYVLLWEKGVGGIFTSEEEAVKHYAKENEITEEEANKHLFEITWEYPSIVEVELNKTCDLNR